MDYKDYLRKCLEAFDLLSEEKFNEITKPFKSEDISLDYYSLGDDLNEFLLNQVIESISESAYVDEIYEKDVTVTCVNTIEELDKINDKLKSLGYNFENYNSEKEEILECEEEDKHDRLKYKAIDILGNYTSEQLEEFINANRTE